MCDQMDKSCASCACQSEIPELPTQLRVYLEGDRSGAVRPEHYRAGIEAIDFIESNNLSFNLGNVVKYVSRCYRKGTPVEDLQKAMYYIRREIAAIAERESMMASIHSDGAR